MTHESKLYAYRERDERLRKLGIIRPAEGNARDNWRAVVGATRVSPREREELEDMCPR